MSFDVSGDKPSNGIKRGKREGKIQQTRCNEIRSRMILDPCPRENGHSTCILLVEKKLQTIKRSLWLWIILTQKSVLHLYGVRGIYNRGCWSGNVILTALAHYMC